MINNSNRNGDSRGEGLSGLQSNRERFRNAPDLLEDTFEIQEDGSFLVKSPEESDVMQGHLRGLPIVPGIVLKKLFLHMHNKQDRKVINCQFLGATFPGQKISVGEDGIYDHTGKKIVEISFDTDKEIQTPHNKETTHKEMTENINEYLLQQNAFRFIDQAQKEGTIEEGVQFQGTYTFPKNFMRQENNKIPMEIIEETAAQIASYVTSPDLNTKIPLRDRVQDEINGDAKIFTFKSGIQERNGASIKPGETIYIKGEVMVLNRKMAQFCYIAHNNKGEIIAKGEVAGTVISTALLQRAYATIIETAEQKETIIQDSGSKIAQAFSFRGILDPLIHGIEQKIRERKHMQAEE